ncbi:hypothetical protein AAG565_08740 [Fontimonas sp. SYSU GA230001]|uniref:hypothetical protein n=1 Tax=Fontimonas sp. SYSU GA230001 TaxID=3142450 RepID=UPI0032B476C2
MVSRVGMGIVLALCVLAAQAQDDRRRPGERPGRETELPAEPRPTASPKPVVEPKEALPAPRIGVERRRPGEAAASVEQPAGEATVPAESVSPRIGASERRRPGQPEYTRPGASGERGEPGSPLRGQRVPFAPNKATGLKPVAKPGSDAEFRKEPVADRWQLTRALGLTDYPWYDPYHQNTLKADRPVFGEYWFFNANIVSDTVVEPRRFPIPVAPQGENGPGQSDLIGKGEQLVLAQNLGIGLVLYKGNTTFMPPDWEFRFTPVFNINYAQVEQNRVLNIDPTEGDTREDGHIGVQDLFIDKHLWDNSARYDFNSLRIGIQPFNADFRGFLFRDENLGIRLFGNFHNNYYLYNLAWFRRIEKDTNSGLNDLGEPLRKDDVFVANLYWQDLPVLGMTSEIVALYNRNREGDEASYFNNNGFIERPASIGIEKPRSYDAYYLGLNGDGHFGRLNFTGSAYLLTGNQTRGAFVDRATDLFAYFLAAELSMDFDWRRFRINALYASGDDDPYDDLEKGFDAVFENALFAGADTSFWYRQNVPLIGGGGVAISARNGLLNSLRSSKDEGQSNFTNPGTVLLGIGADLDLTPQLRLSTNLNQLAFADTAVIEAARQQANIDRDIGLDVSLAAIWRPFFTQNVVFRASGAVLVPGGGYKALYGDDELPYSVLLNLTLTY